MFKIKNSEIIFIFQTLSINANWYIYNTFHNWIIPKAWNIEIISTKDNLKNRIIYGNILKKIRQEVDDWLSMILVIAPTTSALNIMTERLLILDYLNSDSNLKNRLFNDFKICLKNYTGHHKKLSYTYKNTIYNIEYRQIITIEKEIETKRCLINTDHGTYYTPDTLNNLLEKLDSRFLKCYRSLIINLEQIESYNLKTNTITFKNKETTFLVSRDKKKDIINYLREIN